MAIQKYERFERISQDFAARIEATDSMTELMTTIVRKNDLDVAVLETELEAAKADCQAMKNKLEDAKTALDTAKAIFEAGVRAYSNQQIANAVFLGELQRYLLVGLARLWVLQLNWVL